MTPRLPRLPDETDMVDSPRDPADRDAPGTPRWVKAVGIAAIIVIVLVLIVMIIGGGEHGPGRHAASADALGNAGLYQEHAEAMTHMPYTPVRNLTTAGRDAWPYHVMTIEGRLP